MCAMTLFKDLKVCEQVCERIIIIITPRTVMIAEKGRRNKKKPKELVMKSNFFCRVSVSLCDWMLDASYIINYIP